MTFLLAAALLVASGLALLRLLRLATGGAVGDVGLAWLVGSGWFAAVAPLLRFGLGLPLSRGSGLLVVLAPVAVLGASRLRGAPSPRPSPPPSGGGEGVTRSSSGGGEGVTRSPAPRAIAGGEGLGEGGRWLPRPLWAYAPMAAYVAVVAIAVLLHGAGTPTHTDDGIRVRAFAPVLAFADAWAPDARAIFVQAGPIPTFVPALGWILAGTVHPFHVNYAVLAELVALLLLAVGLGSARGSPERGWASAFALLSIPLFVYHCTSTYSDAVLAMRVGAGVLFAIEYARTRDHRDAAAALLLFGIAALVKREGELVAAAPAAVLVAQLAVERWRDGRALPRAALAGLGAVVALGIGGKLAAVGLSGAFPMLQFLAQQAGVAADGAAPPQRAGAAAAAARVFFEQALLRSGNAGMIYWILPVAVAVRARALVRTRLVWPLAAVAALLAEVAVSSIALIPQFTLDQSTVHRALLVASVPAALWLGAVLTDAAEEAKDSLAPAKRTKDSLAPTKRRRGSG